MLKLIFDRLSYARDTVGYFRKKGAVIGKGCSIKGADFGSEPWLVHIGNNVLFSSEVSLITHDGALWTVKKMEGSAKEFKEDKIHKYGMIIIKDNCMIGQKATILPGVTVGECSVVGAGSVVTKDVPPHTVVAGNPAHFICTIEEYADKLMKNNLPWDHENYKKNKREEVIKQLTKKQNSN